MISRLINQLFYFYYLILIVRIFLTWIPNIDWDSQPFAFLRSITDPFLNVFRGIIPPIGGIIPLKIFKKGSVIERKNPNGWESQSIFGIHVKNILIINIR
jgi:hypothetical protein